MSKIICFSYERLFHPDGILSGPGSRIWEFSKALKRKGHEVTIAELNHVKDYKKESINFISWDLITLNDIEKEYDVAFILLSSYVNKYFEKIKKIPTIVDLTTPIAIEAQAHSIGEKKNFFLYDGILPTHIALEKGDFFVCANESQKNFYLGMMCLMGIQTFNEKNLRIARFAPNKKKPELENKRKIEKIVGKNKKIILWLGSMFSWFDYETPIKAMKKITEKNKDAVLVFAGGLNPNIPELTKENYENAKKLTRKEKLLNKNVFFMKWVPYEDRLNLYAEASLAIVTSLDTSEANLSYRTRIVDALNARVPVVCTDTDYLGKLIEENKLGLNVPVGDYKLLAKKTNNLLKKEDELANISKRIDEYIKKEFNLDKTIKPIDDFCKKPYIRKKYSNLDHFNIIEKQRERMKDLEYIAKDKRLVAKIQDNEIKHLEVRLREVIREKERFEEMTNKKLNGLNKLLDQQKEIIQKHKEYIGKFRSSVVYPFYKITHSLGKTKIGRLLEKILK